MNIAYVSHAVHGTLALPARGRRAGRAVFALVAARPAGSAVRLRGAPRWVKVVATLTGGAPVVAR